MRRILVAAFTLVLVACVAIVPAPVRADAVADHGKQIYMANNCYLCHGTVGQGGAGPTIAAPHLIPTYDAFAAWVRKTGPGQMPVYTAKALSDADLQAIYDYLQSLKAPTAIPAVLVHP